MYKFLMLCALCLFLDACKKQPGEGGFASIEGKVFVKDYDTYFSFLTGQYYLPGENVFIIYGDGTEVGNSVKTSYDGSFKFNYLRKGTYRIFVVGEDSAFARRSNPKETLVKINITEKKQQVKLEDLIILK